LTALRTVADPDYLGSVEMSMAWIAMALCLLVGVLGAIGVVSPSALLSIAQHLQTPPGLYAAAALRIILGGALLLAAPTSRAPRAIRAVGAIILVAGLMTPFFGLDRFRGILEWWSAQGPMFMRVWAGVALAFGFIMAYTLVPRSRTA
jgi:hypothetical protein